MCLFTSVGARLDMRMYFFCASAFPGDVVDGEWFQVLGVVVGGVSSDDLFVFSVR